MPPSSLSPSSPVRPREVQVLTPDFFSVLDRLRGEPFRIEHASRALAEAQDRRDAGRTQLRLARVELRQARSFCKEQRERISCVRSHWFYGSTLLQPQLWFRGGCKGKIERARRKLLKAQEDDLPRLQREVQRLEVIVLPDLERQVELRLDDLELSANATTERQAMEERAVTQFPTSQYLTLQQQSIAVRQEIEDIQRATEGLDTTIMELHSARNCYQTSKSFFQEAESHNNKYEQLQTTLVPVPRPLDILQSTNGGKRTQTMVADGTKIVIIQQSARSVAAGTLVVPDPPHIFHLDQDGSVISTNFPCPNGCGYLITWHQTHCCGACRRNGTDHGPRCECRSLSTQQGAQLKWTNIRKQQQGLHDVMSHQDDASNHLFMEARKEAKRAERIARQTLASVSSYIRKRHPTTYSGLVNSIANQQVQLGNPHGGCQSSQERRSNIRQEMDVVTHSLSILHKQIGTLQELQSECRERARTLEQNQQELEKMIDKEKECILDDLRQRVLDRSTTFGFNLESSLIDCTKKSALADSRHSIAESSHIAEPALLMGA